MSNILLGLLIFCYSWLNFIIPPAAAKPVKQEIPSAIIICFSGGREILRQEVISGPFADEYKFAHEVTVKDESGEHNLNFAGGLCIIDRGMTPVPKKNLSVSERLNCYSGADEMVTFEVYGRETTVDEYVEGRTFWAKAWGQAFNSDTLHEYLVFGSEACIGLETS